MRVTRKVHWQIKLQSSLFALLFLLIIGLIAVLSVRYNYETDWTFSGRNSLSPASQKLLDQLKGPITIISFAQNPNIKGQVTDLVRRYQQYKPDIELKFINPEIHPNRVRELGVTFESELVIKKGDRKENLNELTEEGLTNALSRVARRAEARVVFLQGHGERDPFGQARFGLGNFTEQLENKGFQIQSLNLTTQPEIPDDTQVLVIVSPKADLLAGEVELIQAYVKEGGNLLWLAEPGPSRGLEPLAKDLAMKLLPGTVIDPNAQLLLRGRGSVTFTLIPQYSSHPVTAHLSLVTLFPQAVALKTTGTSKWQQKAILTTLPRTWSETSDLSGKLQFDEEEDIEGPLTIGFALSRERSTPKQEEGGKQDQQKTADKKETASEPRSQRVVVIGDGDFLSNAYLGYGANLDLGFNIINWLAYEDRLIAVPARTRIDTTLELSSGALWSIGAGFLFVLPVGLLGTGLLIWWQRRRR